ncbi:MAG TPA: DUF1553 domain-containing protein, partial [Pirellulaceae bacterium]|nr:DUF1553 domain-containing protein [Pirellulaceae bacterium]
VVPLRTTTVGARIVAGLVVVLCGATSLGQTKDAARTLKFNRDIRPILSDNCFQCHGPDKTQRKADLRLDRADGAIGTADKPGAIVPGKPDASELVRRLITDDESERMPPTDSGRRLTAAQIDTLKRWVAQGAQFENHWSLVPPERPVPPAVTSLGPPRKDSLAAPRTAIDLFIQAKLASQGVAPSPPAAPTALARRVALDLTGLPPSLEVLDEFLAESHADSSPDAFERLVDRLLASPRLGERLAVRWLDAARYADTSGYQSDGPRYMWRWRDWVINAFNRDMPFDQFTVEQLAGDLLPAPTLEQRIATGFNRNHRGNSEGGIIPEEYAVEYVVDRVDTTATVWLGLTMGCTRCHDHKFDPISQRDFYELYAYFNNVPEYGRAIKEGNSPPYIQAPTPLEQERLDRLARAVVTAETKAASEEPQRLAAQAEWERLVRAGAQAIDAQWFPTDGLVSRIALDGAPQTPMAETTGSAATRYGEGRIGQAAEFTGDNPLALGEVAGFGYFDKFSLSAWIKPSGLAGGTIVGKMTDAPNGDGYYVRLVDGKVQVNLVKRWLDDSLRVETVAAVAPDKWRHVTVVYDGSRRATGVTIYLDGVAQPLKVNLDLLNQTFTTKEPLRVGGGGGPGAGFHGWIDEVRLYDRALTAGEASVLATADPLSSIASLAAEKRSVAQADKLRGHFVEFHAPAALRETLAEVVRAKRERAKFDESISTVMVMEEMPQPRDTFLLKRGEYDKPGEKVGPGVPAVLGKIPTGQPNNRLGFARWLVAPEHPLTARVAVNRTWQMLFGTGLVKTTEDFGSQGEPPSHPELLDWLALEFRSPGGAGNSGNSDTASVNTASRSSLDWSVKRLLRTIVTSHTYRQSSRATADMVQRDPENRLLARGPRGRLPAEAIRDQALFAAGLLVEHTGGPSVKPYQPADLWKELATDSVYTQDHGAALYRRSMYTFWKRTVAPPTMITFDAAGREACIVRETRTNTPLQALTLMNEVTFVEAARVLAQRVLAPESRLETDEARVAQAFRLATCRAPAERELKVLTAGLARHRERYKADPQAAAGALGVGEFPADARLDPTEVAAMTAVASVILNLDEVLNKE